jgi:hypothetical protein
MRNVVRGVAWRRDKRFQAPMYLIIILAAFSLLYLAYVSVGAYPQTYTAPNVKELAARETRPLVRSMGAGAPVLLLIDMCVYLEPRTPLRGHPFNRN